MIYRCSGENSNCSSNNFIIVPDRFSLIAEKLIFKQLNMKSTFNINVVSISKLASLVLSLAKVDFGVENQLSGVLAVYDILSNTQLQSFENANVTYELAKDIYLCLVQLKSCNITPKQLSDEVFDAKTADICKIYEEYEKIMADKFDANDVLNLFAEEISKSELIKNSNFYFLEFDALTTQGYSILEKLIVNAKSVTIGLAMQSGGNEYIYENDLFYKLNQISKKLNINVNSKFVENKLNDFENAISDRVYSIKKQEKIDLKNNEIQIIGAVSIEQEVKKVVEMINFQVKEFGKKYHDFNIVVPNLSNYKLIFEKYFNSENISYYFDCDYSLNDLAPIKFVNKIINFVESLDESSFFEIVNSEFSNLDSAAREEIYSLYFDEGLCCEDVLSLKFDNQNISDFIEKIKSIKNLAKNAVNIQNFVDFLLNIQKNFNLTEINKKLIEQFSHENDLQNIKLHEQFEAKFEQAVKNLGLLSAVDSNFSLLAKIANDVFNSIKISCVPLSTDCIFVGQADLSYFEEKEFLFALGCNQNKMPLCKSDIGILSDKEINQFKNIDVNPSVRTLNRRNRFRLFNILCLAKSNLVMTYLINSKESASELIVSIKKNFLKDGKTIETASDFFNNIIYKETDRRFKAASKFNVRKVRQRVQTEKICNIKSSLYSNNCTSISKIQDYYRCPFYNFVKNALKIVDKKDFAINELDIGNFFHKFCEKYLKNGLKYDKKQEISDLILEIINSNERFVKIFSNKRNKYHKNLLIKYAYNLAKELDRQACGSEFVATEFEKRFYIPLTEDINLTGVIDRVDKTTDNDFRVVDYKTGKCEFSLSKLYHGTQIQLPMYLYALKTFGKNCVGGFYLPIGNFAEKTTKMGGIFINTTPVLKKLDKNLGIFNLKSNLINVSLYKNSTNDEFKTYSKIGICNKEEFDACLDYAFKIAKQSVLDSQEGDISSAPIDAEFCPNCPYYMNCDFNNSDPKNIRKKKNNIKNSSILEIKG